MKARDIMTTEVITVGPDTTIRDVARIFRGHAISGAPVIEDGQLIGIITESDLIARHARPHTPRYLPLLDAHIPFGGQREYREMMRRILGQTARDIMTTPVKTVNADDDLEDVATLMIESRANPVPVMDHGKMVGILSHTDLIRTVEEAEDPQAERANG